MELKINAFNQVTCVIRSERILKTIKRMQADHSRCTKGYQLKEKFKFMKFFQNRFHMKGIDFIWKAPYYFKEGQI